MFHVLGERFETFSEVKKKLLGLSTRWAKKFVPAVLAYAQEFDLPPPDCDDSNGGYM